MSARQVPSNLLGSSLGENGFIGTFDSDLSKKEISEFIAKALETIDFSGKKITLVIPDGTRSCPLPLILPIFYDAISPTAKSLSALIALGTHAPMSLEAIDKSLAGENQSSIQKYPKMKVFNHEWWDPSTFAHLGVITAEEISEISLGEITSEVPISINRLITESDLVIIIGPVFPHEVVGFSGGAKYLFPGVSGQEMIDSSHWLGAIISSAEIIGTLGITPVREMINLAASKIEVPLLALCLVVETGSSTVSSLSFGSPHTAWEYASAVSAKKHIKFLDKPVKRVVSIIPSRYQDIWTAAKGMYKVEPIIQDGGEVILFAPHIDEFSITHKALEDIGYHCREYFSSQMEKFEGVSKTLMAHSSHLRGAGSFSPAKGEQCRITVTLSTGISKNRTESMNLKYLDPSSFLLADYESDSETLINLNAGEILYRLK
jgi:nickel-dependent lactate racemase